MKNNARQAISRHEMLPAGGRVLVALSGGADSVALLHLLTTLRDELGLELSAAHLNHQLRGEESKRDERFVRVLCGKLGVPLTVAQADIGQIAKRERVGIEECARAQRYAFLAGEAGAEGVIATGHTASDNAETILLNLARGTALRGLAGIPPVRGNIIRPLISCTRTQVEAYCREHSLTWIEDATNASDEYTRNRVRHHLLPLLERENPRFVGHMTALSASLRADADFLDELATGERARLTRPDGHLDRGEFLGLAPALQGRILAGLLREAGVTPSGELIAGLGAIIAAGTGSRQVNAEWIFVCERGSFGLRPAGQCATPAQFAHSIPAHTLVPAPIALVLPDDRQARLSVCAEKKLSTFREKDLTYCLDYDRIVNVVTLRTRRPGDKLRPPGRGCTKTLKNLCQERGVGMDERGGRIVIADEAGVLWVEGFGPDERCAVTEQTTRILNISIGGAAK